jgi:hypothetical protein
MCLSCGLNTLALGRFGILRAFDTRFPWQSEREAKTTWHGPACNWKFNCHNLGAFFLYFVKHMGIRREPRRTLLWCSDMLKWGLYIVIWAMALMINVDFAQKSSRGTSIQSYLGLSSPVLRSSRPRPGNVQTTTGRSGY